jgi:hypothetical protein
MGQAVRKGEAMAFRTGYCASCGKETFPGASFCTYCGAARAAAGSGVAAGASDAAFEIKKIGIWSVVKFASIMYALLGLCLALMIGAVGMAGFPVQRVEGIDAFGGGAWKGLLFVFPIFFGFIGAFTGLSIGLLYNILAWGLGGIRITLKGFHDPLP